MYKPFFSKKTVFLWLLCVLLCDIQAQYYSTGADPASTDWCQIKTEYFQIVFPVEYTSQAQLFANKMDYAYNYVAKSMPSKSRKLSVIIHTQTANSNGMVAWTPRRMELWTTPSQDAFNYSQEWMEQLIVHETRHFVQENKMDQGFTKVLKIILGEQAEMIPLGLFTRQWFMEGDAVATETALSHAGRGRMPSFEEGLRALTLEKGKQSYDVAHLGTYNHYVPNHYEIGYHTVAVNRLFRDSAMFDKKMDDIGRFRTLRGFRDSRKTKYYGFAIDYLEQAWQWQDSLVEKTPYRELIAPSKEYNSYTFLQEDAGSLYAVRNSFSQIPDIIAIDSLGNQQVVAHIGWKAEPDFSVCNGRLVFADVLPDARWEQRSFADLFVMDLHSDKVKRLTREQVYQSPCFNADASKIVAQRVDGNGVYCLHILNAENGEVLEEIPNPKNQFYFSPKWSDDGTKILYVAQEKDKKSLKYYNLLTREEFLLVDGTYGEMAHPVCFGDKVYFTASYSGINNIYECDITTQAVTRITSARFGADYAAVLDGQLYYSNYTSDGYRPVEYIKSDVAGESLADVLGVSLGLGDMLTEQEGDAIDFSQAPDNKYDVKNYSRLGHLVHFHSWIPMVSVDDNTSKNGTDEDYSPYAYISFLSQNKLSTSFLTATYDGDPANSAEKYEISYNYDGFYPKLGLDVSWGDFVGVAQGASNRRSTVYLDVNTLVLRPSVALPFTYKHGVYSLYFYHQFFGEYVRRSIEEYDYTDSFFSRGFYSVFVRAKQSAVRDLYSPYRQQLSFYVSYDDFYSDHYKLAANVGFNFPGLLPHHSLQFGFNWQKKDMNNSNVLNDLPRGYDSRSNTDIAYFSGDYLLPLAYPDFNLGSLLNVKRCSLGLYGDLATINDDIAEQRFMGAGGSLFLDMNFLRYEVDFRVGLQAGIANYEGNDELTFPVNVIFNFNVF